MRLEIFPKAEDMGLFHDRRDVIVNSLMCLEDWQRFWIAANIGRARILNESPVAV